MKIYTKTGDKGETSLYGGKRVSKANLRVEAYGTVDELNSLIGIILSKTQNSKLKTQSYISKLKTELIKIQNDLFSVSSVLANPTFNFSRKARSSGQLSTFNSCQERIKEMENMIDEMNKKLPELNHFILPGRGELGSLLHFARSVCRRAERRVVGLIIKEKVDENAIVYLNRLSDLLFVMARYANFKEKKKEIIWSQRPE